MVHFGAKFSLVFKMHPVNRGEEGRPPALLLWIRHCLQQIQSILVCKDACNFTVCTMYSLWLALSKYDLLLASP